VHGPIVDIQFRGKSGKSHAFRVNSPRLARIIRQCEELPGQHLFEYVDPDGEVHPVRSQDVNAYIRGRSGRAFSAKDFRTLAGTVLAARALRAQQRCENAAQESRAIRAALEVVASRLGNTVAVCRKSYVHPAVFDAFRRSRLEADSSDLRIEEVSVLRMVAKFVHTRDGSVQLGAI
jgi:DNA topoisomerase-1